MVLNPDLIKHKYAVKDYLERSGLYPAEMFRILEELQNDIVKEIFSSPDGAEALKVINKLGLLEI